MGRRAWRDDEAVSEVVGTVLLVAISILLFSGLSLVVWQQMQTSPLPVNVDLRTDVDGEWVSVTHTWGESLPVAETRFLVTVGGTRFDYRLDEAPLAGHLDDDPSGSPDHWDLGETLWLACPEGETCALPQPTGQKLDSVTSVDRRANAVISSTLPGVTQGLILNPLPDLVVATEPVVDLTPSDGMFEGCTYRFRAVVANTGLEPTPDGTDIVTQFYLDGSASAFPPHTRTSPLAVGSTYVVEFERVVSGAGTHTFKAVVDEDGTIAELSEENSHQRSFTLLPSTPDPEFAFEDADDDGFYNPCVGDDTSKHGDIMDGVHGTLAGSGVGIVIPPSVDPISVAGPISFTPDGSLTVGVDLSATASNGVTFDAKNKVTFLGSPTITATGPIDIDAVADIDASGVTFVAEGFPVTVDSSAGSILADELSVPVGVSADATRLEVRALGYVTAKDADVNVQNGILIQASGASGADSLLLERASLVADPGQTLFFNKAIHLNGEGDVHVEGMFMRTTKDWIGVQVSSVPSSNTFFFENLDCRTLLNEENQVFLTPLGANRDAGAGAPRCTVV